jgi:hypothetical protein
VTQLEKFRRYMSGIYEFETEQNVIDTITAEFKGNAYTRIGTAFHSIVETGHPDCVEVPEGTRTFLYYGRPKTEDVPCGRQFDIDGCPIKLDVAQCKVALKYRDEHPNAFHEIRRYKDYGDAIVTGCADMIDGLIIRDIKTKYSSPSDRDYTDSCQWRYYLELFDLSDFYFDLFIFNGYKLDKHGYDARGLEIERYPEIHCLRYPNMEHDNRNLLSDFLEWAESRNLMECLINQKIK